MSKPFLILASRSDEVPAASERAAVPRIAGLDEGDYRWVRMEREGFPEVNLDDWSGIIICGSPFDAGTPEADKSDVQRRIDAGLYALYPRILDEAFPFLGICYGLGTMTLAMGGAMDSTFGEEISAPRLHLTELGRRDPLLAELPDTFHSYVGHHEAVSRLAAGSAVLVEGEVCPVHMIRVGDKAWATQFHPELDLDGIENRIAQYAGRYYAAERAEEILEEVRSVDVSPCHSVLRRFVDLHRR